MIKLIALCLFLLLSSCGYRQVDTLTFESSSFRCAADGLCLHATGNYSLQIGFRRGPAEIRIDLLDAQTQHRKTPQNFAVRVIDQHLNPLLLSDNGRMPATWDVRHQDSHMIKHFDEFCTESSLREELVEQLAASLKQRGGAKDLDRQEAYQVALQIIEDMVEANNKVRRVGTETTIQEKQKPTHQKSGTLLLPPTIYGSMDSVYGFHDLHEALAVARLTSVGRDDIAHRQLQQQLQPSLSGSLLEAHASDYGEYVQQDSAEFHQTVYLWKKPAPAMMRVFPFEGAEYSASAIELRARGPLTGYAWIVATTARTRNHGTKAESASMQHYATCDMYPTTFGHYAWKGDCAGKWGLQHLCNDDTALQLYHAAGNWSGGQHCPLTHRKFAPLCDAVWEPNGERISATTDWKWL